MGNCKSSKRNKVQPSQEGSELGYDIIPSVPKRTSRVAPLPTAILDPTVSPAIPTSVIESSSAIVDTVEGHVRDESGLLYKEASANSTNLVATVKKGDIESVKALLKEKDCDVNMKGMWGSTPLITALQYGHSNLARLLLDVPGIDANHLNEKGAGALLFACMDNNIELVILLLARGVNISPSPAISIYNALLDRNMQCTPMSAACTNGCDKVICALIAAGCDVNMRFGFNCLGSVLPAGQVGSMDVTPLMLACAYGRPTTVTTLLDFHADLTVQCNSGNTCLHYAARSGKLAAEVITQFLLRQDVLLTTEAISWGEWFSIANASGDTALHVACDAKAVEFVKKLLSSLSTAPSMTAHSEDQAHTDLNHHQTPISNKVALINQQNPHTGFTPLHVAVKRRCLEIVAVLLEYGADPLLEDNRSVTALDLASQQKKDSPLLQLIESVATSWRARKAVNNALGQTNEISLPQTVVSPVGTVVGLTAASSLVVPLVNETLGASNQREDAIDSLVQSANGSGINREILQIANQTAFIISVSGPLTPRASSEHEFDSDIPQLELVRSVTPVIINNDDPKTPSSLPIKFNNRLRQSFVFATPDDKSAARDPLLLMSITPSCIEAEFDPTPRRS